MAQGDEDAFLAALERPPAALDDQARLVREAEAAGPPEDSSPEVGDAFTEITRWAEVNCPPERDPGDSPAAVRRLAPPAGTDLDGFMLCDAGRVPGGTWTAEGSGAVLYGEIAREDPYTGPMVGVLWGPEEHHEGDGDVTPVTVRGAEGVAAPISVFQQVVLSELGTVIAWEEAGVGVGLYGRFWDPSRIGELVALADRLVFEAGSFHLPEAALPPGYGQVFNGGSEVMSAIIPAGASYDVRYQPDGDTDPGRLLSLSAGPASAEESEAYRFFGLDTSRGELDGRSVVTGSLWGFDEGPAVVSWREADGLTVRWLGMGVDVATVRKAAAATRELNQDEWAALVESAGDCYSGPGPSIEE